MYLSDLFVAAYKKGGEPYVDSLLDFLPELPGEFWEQMGGYQWLQWVVRKHSANKAAFYQDLKKYSESQEWANGSRSLGEFMGFEEPDADL